MDHFTAGLIIALATGWMFRGSGLLFSVLAGAGKEAFDLFVENEFWDNVDLLNTIAGGFIGEIFWFFIR